MAKIKEGIEQLTGVDLKEYKATVLKLIQVIRDRSPQDIFISSGETLEIKVKGRLTEASELNIWDTDVFDFFLGNICKRTVKGRTKANYDAGQMDYGLTNALLEAHNTSYDFSMSLDNQTLRIHLYSQFDPNISGNSYPALSIRVVETRLKPYEDLHLPVLFKRITELRRGLVLVAGHTASGKSTTVATLINIINTSSSERLTILTIEDPVEYIHKSSGAKIIQKSVGINTPSFEQATEDALRENVDIVMIGELRGPEEMNNALRLAETGKMVIATVHANSVADTVERIINEFPGDVQDNYRARLAENLVGILHQNLEIYNGNQYPVAHGFLVMNPNDQSELRLNLKNRSTLVGLMKNEGHPWVVTYKKSFEELNTKVVFEDVDDARQKFTVKL